MKLLVLLLTFYYLSLRTPFQSKSYKQKLKCFYWIFEGLEGLENWKVSSSISTKHSAGLRDPTLLQGNL